MLPHVLQPPKAVASVRAHAHCSWIHANHSGSQKRKSTWGAVAYIVEVLYGTRHAASHEGPLFAAFSISDSRLTLVSSPSLRVRSGESAWVTVGTETPVLGNVTPAPQGQLVQSVDYRPSGVILELTPPVRSESVYVHARQQLSSFMQTSSGVNNSPTLP
jgi:type II secretory pathway component GspD/PulD (secretin)